MNSIDATNPIGTPDQNPKQNSGKTAVAAAGIGVAAAGLGAGAYYAFSEGEIIQDPTEVDDVEEVADVVELDEPEEAQRQPRQTNNRSESEREQQNETENNHEEATKPNQEPEPKQETTSDNTHDTNTVIPDDATNDDTDSDFDNIIADDSIDTDTDSDIVVPDDSIDSEDPTDTENQGDNDVIIDQEDIDVVQIEVPENPDEIADAIISVEEVDPNDYDGDQPYEFTDVETVYDIEGNETTQASYIDMDGETGVMIDNDGDGIFDMISTDAGVYYAVEDDSFLTVADAEFDAEEGYIAYDEDEDFDIEDDPMDDIIDSTDFA